MYVNGKKNGHGKFTWADGNIYNGEFRNNVIEGYGEYYWNNSTKTPGESKHTNTKGGKRVYRGKWKNGMMHGEG